MSQNTIPTIFSGFLPSLRRLSLPKTLLWPPGLFGDLTSFECGTRNCFPGFPAYVFHPEELLDRIPLCCGLLPTHPRDPMDLLSHSSLRKCTLIREGIAPLIRFIVVPATALVSLGKKSADDWTALPKFQRAFRSTRASHPRRNILHVLLYQRLRRSAPSKEQSRGSFRCPSG